MLRALFALCLLCCIVLSEGRPRRHFSKHGKWRRAMKGVNDAQVDLADRIVNGVDASKTSHPYLVSILLAANTEQPCAGNAENTGNTGNTGSTENTGNNGDDNEYNPDEYFYYDYGDTGDDDWEYEGTGKGSRLAARVPRPWQLGVNMPGNSHGQWQQQEHRPNPGNGNANMPWWNPQPSVEAGNDKENETKAGNEVRPVVGHGHGLRPGNSQRPSFMQARGNARRRKDHPSRRHLKAKNNQYSHICGGTLIDPQWVLTAAHCIMDGLQVKIGEYDLSNHLEPHEEVIPVIHSIPHPCYDKDTMTNDIALLKLNKSVDISKDEIDVILLPTTALLSGTNCTIAGWGNTNAVAAQKKRRGAHGSKKRDQGTETPKFPSILQEADVQVQTQENCKNAYNNEIQDTMVCASTPGKDSCQGDSGGPLICQEAGKKVVAGVVLWGYGCAQEEYPGVYTRVHSFLTWINCTIQGQTKCNPTCNQE